jgi:hypothetical protein
MGKRRFVVAGSVYCERGQFVVFAPTVTSYDWYPDRTTESQKIGWRVLVYAFDVASSRTSEQPVAATEWWTAKTDENPVFQYWQGPDLVAHTGNEARQDLRRLGLAPGAYRVAAHVLAS